MEGGPQKVAQHVPSPESFIGGAIAATPGQLGQDMANAYNTGGQIGDNITSTVQGAGDSIAESTAGPRGLAGYLGREAMDQIVDRSQADQAMASGALGAAGDAARGIVDRTRVLGGKLDAAGVPHGGGLVKTVEGMEAIKASSPTEMASAFAGFLQGGHEAAMGDVSEVSSEVKDASAKFQEFLQQVPEQMREDYQIVQGMDGKALLVGKGQAVPLETAEAPADRPKEAKAYLSDGDFKDAARKARLKHTKVRE
jgi:hypothetical protein